MILIIDSILLRLKIALLRGKVKPRPPSVCSKGSSNSSKHIAVICSMDFADICSFWRQQRQHGLCRCLQLLASATATWTLLMFAAFGVSNSSMDFAFLSWLKGPKMQFFARFFALKWP
ncbi:MAG: hypothetical protein ACLQMT_09655 [Candidatus Acidiferrales bacterium]